MDDDAVFHNVIEVPRQDLGKAGPIPFYINGT